MSTASIDRSNADMIIDRAMAYQKCRACGFVDRDPKRRLAGHKCSVCGSPSEGGWMFLDISTQVLIRHIYEAFHFPDIPVEQSHVSKPEEYKNLSVVVFFCVLKEVLLESFLYNLMEVMKLPAGVIERLLADNDSHMRRLDQLFPSLTGLKWKNALSQFTPIDNKQFHKLDELLQRASKARNSLLHQADHFSITPALAEECFNAISILLDCYMHLNNLVIHPIQRVTR